MAEKRLKLVTVNTNFFGRVASTIRNVLVPTKIGVNTFIINMKRNSYIKAYKVLERAKEGYNQDRRAQAEEEFKEAYNEYLEAIDKYIMDSIYTKASTQNATKVEKKALSDYYKITTYKDNQYDEYKYKKQIFLLTLDNDLLKEKNKKVDNIFPEIYTNKQNTIYRNLLKNYSVRLLDNTSVNKDTKNAVYLSVFRTLEDYIKDVLPIEMKNSKTNKYNTIKSQYDAYRSYVGKLDEKESLEKNMLLLSMSRTLFTHSLPLGIVEKCYEKLLKDTRVLMVRNLKDKKTKSKNEAKIFSMIKLIVEEYNNKILSGKIYWDDKEEKAEVQKFWNSYKLALTEKEKDILLCQEELRLINKDIDEKLKNAQIKCYYIKKLRELGVRIVNGVSKKYTNKKFTRTINSEVNV